MIPSARLVQQAAELRAAGHPWEVVADRLGRAGEDARAWPEVYPDFWVTAYELARHNVLAEGEAEAVCILRRQLRLDDERLRQGAARKLIDHGDAGRSDTPQSQSSLAALAIRLEELSDDEIDILLAQLRDERPPEDRNPAPQPAALPPGPP